MKIDILANKKSFIASEIKRHSLAARLLDQFGERLADTAEFNPSYYSQAVVDNREDLTLLMTLAPKWAKTPGENGIYYEAEVDGERFQIIAKAAALPQTCKMVQEDYLIPAQEAKPASVGTRMVLKCDAPKAEHEVQAEEDRRSEESERMVSIQSLVEGEDTTEDHPPL